MKVISVHIIHNSVIDVKRCIGRLPRLSPRCHFGSNMQLVFAFLSKRDVLRVTVCTAQGLGSITRILRTCHAAGVYVGMS